MTRPRFAAGAAWCAAAAITGCADADGRVVLAFDPPVGTVLAYRTEVESTTDSDLPCLGSGEQASGERAERATLQARHEILPPGPEGGVRVEVELARSGVGTRTFVVRFDRAAQLTAVEEVEGVDAAALGELGLSELFPAAAGAPPEAPLAPGDRWSIDEEVVLDGDAPSRLRGEGHLRELGVVDGHDTATVVSETRLEVRTSSVGPAGTRTIAGEQRSAVEATYDLETGAVRTSTAQSVGEYRVVLAPPEGAAGRGPADACEGTLRVELHSRVTREPRG